MKNTIFLKIANTYFFILFLYLLSFGQSSFSPHSLLGPEYKIIQIEKTPRFAVQFEFGKLFPFKKGIENYNGGGMESLLQMVYSDPQLFEELFETLGGEFFIGSFSETPDFENFQQSNGNLFGISLAYRINSYFETAINFRVHQSQITADFPIVVFDQTTFETITSNGKIFIGLKSKTFQVVGNYYPFSGVVQPFAGAGMSYTFAKPSKTSVQIKDVVFNLSENPAMNSFGLAFNAGVSFVIVKNVVLQINGQAFSVAAPGGCGIVWNKVLSSGVGVRF